MISDVVKEQLVARKFGKLEALKTAGLALLFIAAAFLVLLFASSLFWLLVLLGGVFWLAYQAFGWFVMQEFEYLAVNGELTIDRIRNKSRRKRMYTIDLRSVETIGRYTPEMRSKIQHTVFKNCSDSDNPALGVYMVFKSKAEQQVLLVIAPDKKMRDAMKPFIAPRLIREGFPGGEF